MMLSFTTHQQNVLLHTSLLIQYDFQTLSLQLVLCLVFLGILPRITSSSSSLLIKFPNGGVVFSDVNGIQKPYRYPPTYHVSLFYSISIFITLRKSQGFSLRGQCTSTQKVCSTCAYKTDFELQFILTITVQFRLEYETQRFSQHELPIVM